MPRSIVIGCSNDFMIDVSFWRVCKILQFIAGEMASRSRVGSLVTPYPEDKVHIGPDRTSSEQGKQTLIVSTPDWWNKMRSTNFSVCIVILGESCRRQRRIPKAWCYWLSVALARIPNRLADKH